MQVWIDNAQTSFILGVLFFVVMFFPGLIWQYQRHGRPTLGRMVGWLVVCVYITALFVYTFIPLPSNGAEWCATHHIGRNLTPFKFVEDIRRETAGMTVTQRAQSAAVLQVVFNVVLFVPFGAIMKRYFGRGIGVSTIIGFLTSACIEITQYTGIFGLYPCSIRVGDVDDLIMNTAGALIGALMAPALLWWIPNAQVLAATRLQPRPVTVWRRWAGMVIDAVLLGIVQYTTTFAIHVVRWITSDTEPEVATWERSVGIAVGVLFVFVIPALTGRAASAGQKIVWLTPTWLSRSGTTLTNGTIVLRILRSLVVVGPWALANYLSAPWNTIGFGVVLLAIIMVPFTRSHRSLSGVITGALMVDSRSAIAGGPDNEAPEPLSVKDKEELDVRR